jgi:hypothetical protein
MVQKKCNVKNVKKMKLIIIVEKIVNSFVQIVKYIMKNINVLILKKEILNNVVIYIKKF